MNRILYDAAVLVSADRNERRVWAEHKARLEFGVLPLVPSPVVAQVSRSPQQGSTATLPGWCEVISLDESGAHEAGQLLGKSRTADVVDAVVVSTALRLGASILTSDEQDLKPLVAASGHNLVVLPV